MKFKVTTIDFDFSSDDSSWGDVDPDYQKEVVEETVNQIWQSDNEEELIEIITSHTGWLINSIDYQTLT